MRIRSYLQPFAEGVLLPIMCFGFMSIGCAHTAKMLVAGGRFSVTQLSQEKVPKKFDLTRTYYYQVNPVKPDSLLEALALAGFRVKRAWYCDAVHYGCMDTVGPHFTIELSAADPRILDHGFVAGVGKIWCATEINEYETTD